MSQENTIIREKCACDIENDVIIFLLCETKVYSWGEVTDQSIIMSLDLNDAAMAGNAEEVRIRLRMGESPNQKFYPR